MDFADGLGIDLLPPEGQTQAFPLVVLTSQCDEQAAVEAMKAGALDYVAKSPSVFRDIPRLAERALREWQHIIERQRAEEERRKLDRSQKMLAEEWGVAADVPSKSSV